MLSPKGTCMNNEVTSKDHLLDHMYPELPKEVRNILIIWRFVNLL